MAVKPLNTIYKIKAECLTPLIIKSGNEIMPWEYVIFQEDGKNILYRFDVFRFYNEVLEESDDDKKDGENSIKKLKDWAAGCGVSKDENDGGKKNKSDKKEFNEKLNDAIDLEKGNVLGVRKFIFDIFNKKNKSKEEIEKIAGYEEKIKKIAVYKEEASDKFFDNYDENIGKTKRGDESSQIEETKQKNDPNQLAVKEFTRSGGKSYVPGSSFKGAIKTTLLWNLTGYAEKVGKMIEEVEKKHKDMPNRNKTERDIEREKARRYKEMSENEYENEFKDFLATDSDFVKDGQVKVGLFDRSASQSMEYLVKKTEFKFQIRINEARRKLSKENKLDFSEENIVKSANEFTKYKIKEYIADSERLLRHRNMSAENQKNKKNKTEKLIGFYKKLLGDIDKLEKNKFILNFAFGGSFWYKSFFEKHPKIGKEVKTFVDDNINISRSLWMIDGDPLGFIKCEINKKND